MDWSPYADRINSLLVRSEQRQNDNIDVVGAILTSLVVVFGLTEEEHFNLDLAGMDENLEQAMMRVLDEMRAGGVDID